MVLPNLRGLKNMDTVAPLKTGFVHEGIVILNDFLKVCHCCRNKFWHCHIPYCPE